MFQFVGTHRQKLTFRIHCNHLFPTLSQPLAVKLNGNFQLHNLQFNYEFGFILLFCYIQISMHF